MSDVAAQMRRLRPLVEEHAAADPEGDRLAEPVVEAVMRQSDLLRMWLPRELGGLESSTSSVLEAVDELTYADGATAWVAMASVFATGAPAAYCGDSAVRELWGPDRMAIMEGTGMPGRAEVTDGGYVLSGKWSYGSGMKHATHAYSAAHVYEDGERRLDANGNPEMIMLVTPIEQVELRGNWDVMGLRRTGSVDYTIDGAFVPQDYTHSGEVEGSDRGGPLYTLGMMGLACVLHTAWAMGNGRRALDELAEFATKRSYRVTGEAFQLKAAEVHARFHSACAWVREIWADIDRTLERDEPLSTRQHTLYRLALHHVTFVSADVTEFVYRASGGVGLRQSRIQHCFRDANATTQHVILADRMVVSCGRELLGLEPGAVWVGNDDLGAPPKPAQLEAAAS